MKNRTFPLLALTMVFVLAQSGCAFLTNTVWQQGKQTHKLEVAKAKRIKVDTHNGSISVRGEKGIKEVVVNVTKEGGAATNEEAKKCLEAIEILAYNSGDVVTVGWKWKQTKGQGWRARVRFDVLVPQRFAAQIKSHNGAVNVDNVAGDLKVKTHNGSVKAKGFHAALNAETHNGSIRVDGRTNNIRLESHNGGIRAKLRGDKELAGSIETHNGGVRVDFGSQVRSQVNWRTRNGSITVKVPMQGISIKKRNGSGQLGDGKKKLRIKTSNGSIRLGTANS